MGKPRSFCNLYKYDKIAKNRKIEKYRLISVIVNPVAGKGRAKQVLPKIQAYLTKHALPYTVHMTESQGDGVRCAKQALAEGCDRVLAVGGDGTAREVAEGLCRSNSVLGIVPAGTGNDFARTFHLSGELSKVLDIAVYGKGMPIDVFDTDSGIYINICSVRDWIPKPLTTLQRCIMWPAPYRIFWARCGR